MGNCIVLNPTNSIKATRDRLNRMACDEEKREKLYLLKNVMVEILSRLPVKSLLRFKCVCKEWHNLISSQHFTSSHLNCSISNPLRQSILVHLDEGDELVHFHPVTFSPYTTTEISNFSSYRKCIEFVGSINGILCVCGRAGTWVCLWNPATRMVRKIKTGIKHHSIESYSIGFGFDCITDDYKVVVIYSIHRELKTRLKVWSTKLESWREIEVDSIFTPRRFVCDVTLNEFAYWIVKNGHIVLIASFNMSTEVLRLVPMPRVYIEYMCAYNGLIWKNKFALATFDHLEGLDQIWTLENDTHGNEYWNKEYEIPFEAGLEGYGRPINFENGKLLRGFTRKELILYDPETRKMKKSDAREDGDFVIAAHYYVESLNSIKGFKPVLAKTMNKQKRNVSL